jgi:hypothetical protein
VLVTAFGLIGKGDHENLNGQPGLDRSLSRLLDPRWHRVLANIVNRF